MACVPPALTGLVRLRISAQARRLCFFGEMAGGGPRIQAAGQALGGTAPTHFPARKRTAEHGMKISRSIGEERTDCLLPYTRRRRKRWRDERGEAILSVKRSVSSCASSWEIGTTMERRPPLGSRRTW